MKSILKVLMALFLCLGATCFSGCTDDDEQSNQNFEELIIGTWKGYNAGWIHYEFGEYVGYEEGLDVVEDADELRNYQMSFDANGSAIIAFDGKTVTVTWEINENKLYLTGKGENEKATYNIEELNSSNMILYIEPNIEPDPSVSEHFSIVRWYFSKLQ